MSLTATQLAWVNNPTAQRMLTVVLPATGDLPPVYLSTEPFTGATVTFQPIIKGEFTLRRAVGGFLLGGGANEIGVGKITVIDTNNDLASWTLKKWRDRDVSIWWGNPEWGSIIDDHILVLRTKVEKIEQGDGVKNIILRPTPRAAEILLPASRYEATLGGEALGEPIQIALGKIRNAPVQLIDGNTLLYGMAGVPGADVKIEQVAVKDNGVVLTDGVDYTITPIVGNVPNAFTRLDLDNVIGTVTFDSEPVNVGKGGTASRVLDLMKFITINYAFELPDFPGTIGITPTPEQDGLKIGLLIRESRSVLSILDEIAMSTGHVWYFRMSTFVEPTAIFRQVQTPSGAPVITFSDKSISGGIVAQKVSDALFSVVLGVRNSWVSSGDDAIDPALAPSTKKALQKEHLLQVASTNQQLVDEQKQPIDVEPILTLLTEQSQAATEGARWQQILSIDRYVHTFRALTGAAQLEPLDAIQIEHSDLSDYSPLVDERKQVIANETGSPLLGGVRARIKVIEESFPSGQVLIEAWA